MTTNVKEILAQREANYGAFKTQAALAQSLKDVVRNSPHYADKPDYQREAVEMILHKIGRWANSPCHDYKDNFVDMAGYAQLVVEELEEQEAVAKLAEAEDKAKRIATNLRTLENLQSHGCCWKVG